MLARIHITLKKDVLDPQGSVIANSLKSLGLGGLKGTAKSNKKCNIESSKTHVNLDNNDIAQKCNKCDISKLKKNYYKFKKDFE